MRHKIKSERVGGKGKGKSSSKTRSKVTSETQKDCKKGEQTTSDESRLQIPDKDA